jgi:hypothetical protein
MDSHGTYPPLNTLKRVADNVWIVDGPIIRFGSPWPKFRFPTRMTVMRLAGDQLFIHSPTALSPELEGEIGAVGVPRWIVAPNRTHYWWVPDWHAGYPGADVYLAPRTREQAGSRIDFDTFTLERDCGYAWDAEVATLPVPGSYMTEFTFFHRASRTLVLTDLVENFERPKLDWFLTRWLTRWAGAQDPDGGMPRDMRVTFAKERPQMRAAVLTMIRWNPDRVILAHGRWYEQNGAAELRRAFRWLLD